MVGIQSIISGAVTVVLYVLILAAIYKIFQIGSDVSEIKATLKGMKSGAMRTQPGGSPGSVARPDSAEALVRAVHAASYQELEDTISADSKRV